MPKLSLESKYIQEEGTIILSGLQALLRLPLDQHKADKRAGLNTAVFISGYRGSPLGGFDFLLEQNQPLLQAHQTFFQPGVNEDLAATAVMGSQLANTFPHPKYDGVLGIWYGKGPGVDRTGDIFKHAQTAGVGRYGGVLALAGDDPTAKSSTIPSHSEVALYDAQMPILFPGNAQEVIEFGRYGFELSRYSGSWVGFKFVTNVADEYSTAQVWPIENIVKPAFEFDGKPWRHTQNPALLAPYSLQQEREIHEGRLTAAALFAEANSLNRIVGAGNGAWLGLVCAGKTYYDVREALYNLGLDDNALQQYGIRLLKIGLMYPMEPNIVKKFARGLEEIFIIEEKRAFLELFIRDVLYNQTERPRIVGKRDEAGNFLVRGDSELDADQIMPLLAQRLKTRLPAEMIEQRLARLQGPQTVILPMAGQPAVARTPYFCSGCPHNRSTTLPEGSLQGGGIGCHTLSILMDRNVQGVTQMGGEGAQWVGASPFSDTKHIFQNIGDGTLFHSGSLAIRQALAAKVNITYKILYNGAVAMTGGQHADGEIPVPELTRALQAEGVSKIIVCASDINKYPANARWAENAEVWDRERLDEAQRQLREIKGVTALIYDQPCAADLRRKRKRGQAPVPQKRVFINEAVCEGCGDCGAVSNCLSVFPIETEFGRKTQIHQSSCNLDFTCLKGDCPAFITVIPDTTNQKERRRGISKIYFVDRPLPEPTQKVPANANIYMMGIGGTGVVTVNQILATAALLEGKHIKSLDQTGLSQKGGPVVSHLKILAQPLDVSNKIGAASADAYIVFDMLSATADKNLAHAHPDKTIAVVSASQIPTGSMVKSTAVQFPPQNLLKYRLEGYTRKDDNVYLDAIALSEALFGSHMPANLMTIGAAYQAGALPISAGAIEQAIELNGVAVEANKQAFRVGRLTALEPDWANTVLSEQAKSITIKPEIGPEAQRLIDAVGAEGELKRLLEIRTPELIDYQNVAYAEKYTAFVSRVLQAERQVSAQTALSEAVARYLFKLMAYKDEYEVARLHLKKEVAQALENQFGKGAKISWLLHPPFMRAVGMKNKLAFGSWFKSGYWLLEKLKVLRGTPFDLFGYAHVRKTERALIAEYRAMIEGELAGLSAENLERVIELAGLPDMIRGYEGIKLANVERYRAEVVRIQQEKVEA